MDDPELLKEFIRDAFMEGALDLGRGEKYLKGFLRIFAGEMEALIAVNHARYLTADEKIEMLKLARPDAQTLRDFTAWADRIN